MICEFEHVEVYTGSNGHVCIRQNIDGVEETIILNPEQIPQLVKWLKFMAREAMS